MLRLFISTVSRLSINRGSGKEAPKTFEVHEDSRVRKVIAAEGAHLQKTPSFAAIPVSHWTLSGGRAAIAVHKVQQAQEGKRGLKAKLALRAPQERKDNAEKSGRRGQQDFQERVAKVALKEHPFTRRALKELSRRYSSPLPRSIKLWELAFVYPTR
ncbi:MAG: hypothetical protein M3Q07_03375, partial [Pseudobdellovibrionaceae bacterium]|nr:hypothetical protein [Pseudobdellovibrionaceae bacterium]